jgi:hypothetical protein
VRAVKSFRGIFKKISQKRVDFFRKIPVVFLEKERNKELKEKMMKERMRMSF